MSIYVLGIDPGINGGIVTLTNGKITDISAMPTTLSELVEHFRYLGLPQVYNRDTVNIIIEDVHSMPTDGVRAAFTFGHGLGQLEGVIAALSPVEALERIVRVPAQIWMKYFNLKRDKETDEAKYDYKKRVKETALKLVDNGHKLKITLKTCDAYLIALYGYRSIKNEIKTN